MSSIGYLQRPSAVRSPVTRRRTAAGPAAVALLLGVWGLFGFGLVPSLQSRG